MGNKTLYEIRTFETFKKNYQLLVDQVLFFGIIVTSAAFFSCSDPCQGPGGGSGDFEGRVFFTGTPLNSQVSAIYSVDPDGRNLQQHVSQGLLYSPPTSDNRMIFLRIGDDGIDYVMLYDLNMKREEELANSFIVDNNITFPVISGDGNYVAMIIGDNILSIVRLKQSYNIRHVAGSILRETIPVFSSDGKWLAFFRNEQQGSFELVVISSDDENFIKYKKVIERNVDELAGELTIDWSEDNQEIMYALTDDDSSKIIVTNIETSEEAIYRVDIFKAITPVFSPKEINRVAFVSGDKNIWTMNLDAEKPDFRLLTSQNPEEINESPDWSAKGDKIIFNNYVRTDEGIFIATLISVTLNKEFEAESSTILSNNVFKGFWKN